MRRILALTALLFALGGCGPQCEVGEMAVEVCTFCTPSFMKCTQTDQVCRPRCVTNAQCGRGSMCTASGYCSISPVCH